MRKKTFRFLESNSIGGSFVKASPPGESDCLCEKIERPFGDHICQTWLKENNQGSRLVREESKREGHISLGNINSPNWGPSVFPTSRHTVKIRLGGLDFLKGPNWKKTSCDGGVLKGSTFVSQVTFGRLSFNTTKGIQYTVTTLQSL